MEKMKINKIHILLSSLLIVFLTGILCSAPLSAETIPVLDGASLIEQAKVLNGQVVIFQGEVIGDIMPRQDHYWINVLCNGTAIGIWITAEQRKAISLAGQYDVQGDLVRITGQFNQACPEHGGDLDIHANSVEISSQGTSIPQKLNLTRLIIAAGLFVMAVASLFMLFSRRFLRRHPVIR
jgi:hypothetical protein